MLSTGAQARVRSATWGRCWRGRSRSIPESKLRLLLRATGIDGLAVNAGLRRPDGRALEIDLLATTCGLAIEYEGAHHQEDRGQYLKDLDRYAAFRSMRLPYKQVTKEAMRRPRSMVLDVYDNLLAEGYQGPAPRFGPTWNALFQPVPECVRRRARPAAAPAEYSESA